MGLLSFIKDAGEKLFAPANTTAPASSATPAPTASPEQLSEVASQAIAQYIRTMGLSVQDLVVRFDAPTATVTVGGQAADQATREKVVLCCGNVAHVAAVHDQMTVQTPAPEGRWHTVVKGDTLSHIAKSIYGDAKQYLAIFEANQPMLAHPDKIYPGQVLRLPAQST